MGSVELTMMEASNSNNNDSNEEILVRTAKNINPYLVISHDVIVNKQTRPLSELHPMDYGNKPTDGGHLILDSNELSNLNLNSLEQEKFVKKL